MEPMMESEEVILGMIARAICWFRVSGGVHLIAMISKIHAEGGVRSLLNAARVGVPRIQEIYQSPGVTMVAMGGKYQRRPLTPEAGASALYRRTRRGELFDDGVICEHLRHGCCLGAPVLRFACYNIMMCRQWAKPSFGLSVR